MQCKVHSSLDPDQSFRGKADPNFATWSLPLLLDTRRMHSITSSMQVMLLIWQILLLSGANENDFACNPLA
jgi:hypothetical protein